MFFKPNPSSGVPIYLQLMEQVKHGIETGALRPGEQLPGIRRVAEDLVMNPNTVAKAYRELEHQGYVELRQGAGAFVSAQSESLPADKLKRARPMVQSMVTRLLEMGLLKDEIRRLVEAEFVALRDDSAPLEDGRR